MAAISAGLGTAIAGALGVGGSIFGTSKQAGAAKRASQEQERARQEALAYERQQQANAEKRRRSEWDQYQQAYQTWYNRYGEKGIDRYGVPVGVTYGKTATPGTPGAPGAPAPGAPAPGVARAPVTLAGGRQVDPDEYARYVAAREQRRGQTIGQLANPMRPGVVT
jgi:hypothetical protein